MTRRIISTIQARGGRTRLVAKAVCMAYTPTHQPGGFETCVAQVGKGRGAEVMGHPLEPLRWLANMLAERGQALKAGMTVITGSIIPPKPLSAGDTATIAIGGLGEAHITVLSAYKGAGLLELSEEEWAYDAAGEAGDCSGWQFRYWFGGNKPVGQ